MDKQMLFDLRDNLIAQADTSQSTAIILLRSAKTDKEKFDCAHAIGKAKGLLDACHAITDLIGAQNA
jgi:hypothetical protein